MQGKQDSLFTFLGRIGPNMGNWYPYVTAGAAVAHQSYSDNFIDTFYPTNVTSSFSRESVGWVVGGGAEMRISDHWLLRGELLGMGFGGFGGNGPIVCTAGVGNCAAGVPNSTTFNFNSRFTEGVGRVAVSYKF
jgi:opacity protein-like surface antigen